MRTKKIAETVERTVYIADTGEQFDSKAECMNFEAEQADRKYQVIRDKLPWFSLCSPDADYDTRMQWFYVKNQEELDAVKHHDFFFDSDSSSHEYEAERFPCWVRAMTYNEDDGFGMLDSLETIIADEERYLRTLKALAKKYTPGKGENDR